MISKTFHEWTSFLQSSPKLWVWKPIKKIIKKKPLLNNVLLSTFEFKNAFKCLGDQSMCHQSCYRLVVCNTLGEDIKKNLKCYFDYINLSWAIDSSWEDSTSVKVFYIPPPSFLVFKGTLNVSLIFLQISPKLQVWKTYQET